jgi:hypothetical protein
MGIKNNVQNFVFAAWAFLHSKEIIPKRNCAATVPISHSCVGERFIYSRDRLAYSAVGNMWTDPGNISIAHRHMNVEIGTDAALFTEKEYIM